MTGRALRSLASRSRKAFLLPLFLVLPTACTTIDLTRQSPPGFDLTGTWQLVEEASGTLPSHRRLRARGGMLAFVTHDFPVLEAGEMRIEQNPDSMGIRYDGRDYRDVSWGERQRGLWEVRAGWHEGNLLIISDANDADATETLTLSDGGQRLQVDVHIDSGGEELQVTRVFRRR